MPLWMTQALNGEMVGPAVRRKATRPSITGPLAPQTAPPSTLPCPSRCLVAECTTKSAPSAIGRCSAGVHSTLSTASAAPAFFASAASAAMSATSPSGLDGVSRNSSLVAGRSARCHTSSRDGGTKVVSTPNFDNSVA